MRGTLFYQVQVSEEPKTLKDKENGQCWVLNGGGAIIRNDTDSIADLYSALGCGEPSFLEAVEPKRSWGPSKPGEALRVASSVKFRPAT